MMRIDSNAALALAALIRNDLEAIARIEVMFLNLTLAT